MAAIMLAAATIALLILKLGVRNIKYKVESKSTEFIAH
jgi:hypothetical protein